MAYYIAATAKREEEGMPCAGSCNDRRLLSQVAEAVQNDDIKSYMCLCCSQIRTWAMNWECAYDCRGEEKNRSDGILLRRGRKFA